MNSMLTIVLEYYKENRNNYLANLEALEFSNKKNLSQIMLNQEN